MDSAWDSLDRTIALQSCLSYSQCASTNTDRTETILPTASLSAHSLYRIEGPDRVCALVIGCACAIDVGSFCDLVPKPNQSVLSRLSAGAREAIDVPLQHSDPFLGILQCLKEAGYRVVIGCVVFRVRHIVSPILDGPERFP